MKLYVGAVSGNSYKVKILLAVLKVPCEVVVLDLAAKAHKAPEHLKLNPRGEVPVLVDGDVVLWDSSACLAYIARKHGGEQWFPSTDPGRQAEVMQWLALAASEIQFGLQYGRRGVLQGRWTAGTLEQSQAIAAVALKTLEGRLTGNHWLVGTQPTIADVACFPYVETAEEGQVSLSPSPAVSGWLERCRALPGWPGR